MSRQVVLGCLLEARVQPSREIISDSRGKALLLAYSKSKRIDERCTARSIARRYCAYVCARCGTCVAAARSAFH
jgi:hypothetical protein